MELEDRPRRTQEERRATTKQAILDASVASLLEDGYSGLTTRRVAARAGVSPATQRFHFPDRAGFVEAALEALAVELRNQVAEMKLEDAPEPERFSSGLDELWGIMKGPMFRVFNELSVAAHHDDDARTALIGAERALTRQISQSVVELFPEDVKDPDFRVLVDLATSSMRGLAMLQPVTPQDQVEHRWESIKKRLVGLYDAQSNVPGKESA
jgi:AcrR family transcriptional regulator